MNVVQRIKNKISLLENENAALKKDIEVLETKDDDTINELSKEKYKMEMKVDDLKYKITQSEDNLKYKDKSLNDTITQLETSISEKDELTKQIDTLKQEIKDLGNKLTVKDIIIRKYESNPIPNPTPIPTKPKLIITDDVAKKEEDNIISQTIQSSIVPPRRNGLYYSMGGL